MGHPLFLQSLKVAQIGGSLAPVGTQKSLAFMVGAVLAGLLGVTVSLTVGRSLQRARRRRRRDAVRGDLRSGLLERLYASDAPDWERWVEPLGGLERDVLESLLEEYLRELDGSDAAELAALGGALGIDERARRTLATGGMYERLEALTWLALLRDPPDLKVLQRQCTGNQRERAAAARVLHASDHPELASTGVALMLADRTEGFSVFGIDTLYRVAEADPTPFLDRAADAATGWDYALQAQALLITRQVSTVTGGAELDWVLELLSSPAERTRVEATKALGGYGWKRSLRDRIELDELYGDPSPLVRASTYGMLGDWGDEIAVRSLERAARAEPDQRARVRAAESLLPFRDRYELTVPESMEPAWAWAEAHAAFDEQASDITTGEPA
ncbi:MAG: HEAT repeat domain-containing protein [Halobacteriales archaeon]